MLAPWNRDLYNEVLKFIIGNKFSLSIYFDHQELGTKLRSSRISRV